MDLHVLLPLDADHEAASRRLARHAARAAGLDHDISPMVHHVSLVVIRSGPPDVVRDAMACVARAIAPIVVRAHGYGVFCDGTPSGTSIHVPVVNGPDLRRLHRHAFVALVEAGLPPATWTDPDHWSPHITLLDHGLDPVGLGRAVSALADRHHPRWSIPIDQLVVRGPLGDITVEPMTYALGTGRARRS